MGVVRCITTVMAMPLRRRTTVSIICLSGSRNGFEAMRLRDCGAQRFPNCSCTERIRPKRIRPKRIRGF